MSLDDQQALQELQRRFSMLLPEGYQDQYEDLEPTPMGSAGVRYGADGQVAWDQMWGSFCDLALAVARRIKASSSKPRAGGDRADPAASVAVPNLSWHRDVTDLTTSNLRQPVDTHGVRHRRAGRMAAARDHHRECRRAAEGAVSVTCGPAIVCSRR